MKVCTTIAHLLVHHDVLYWSSKLLDFLKITRKVLYLSLSVNQKKKKGHSCAKFGYRLSEVDVDLVAEPEEKEEWAKPLVQLWQSRLFNPQAEKEYNKQVGLQAPYCSICLLFHTYHQVRPNTPSTQLLFQHFTFKLISKK